MAELKLMHGQLARAVSRENKTSSVKNDDAYSELELHSFIDMLENKRTLLEGFDLMDATTGVGSRRLLVERAEAGLQHAKNSQCTLALICIELEDLPALNRLHGREVSDQLLVELANRIRTNVREIDSISRLGGREFAVVCEQVDSDSGIEQLVQRIFVTLSDKVVLSSQIVWQPHVNIGAVLSAGDESLPQLFHRTEQVMARVRDGGKHHFDIERLALRMQA